MKIDLKDYDMSSKCNLCISNKRCKYANAEEHICGSFIGRCWNCIYGRDSNGKFNFICYAKKYFTSTDDYCSEYEILEEVEKELEKHDL